jgi:hypothetical protein
MASRMARLEGAYEQVSLRPINIDLRLETLDRKIDLLRDAKNDRRFTWGVGIVVTSWVTTIAAIVLHH